MVPAKISSVLYAHIWFHIFVCVCNPLRSLRISSVTPADCMLLWWSMGNGNAGKIMSLSHFYLKKVLQFYFTSDTACLLSGMLS